MTNHSLAAAPCLRSRLAYGVRATPSSLRSVELGEELIRRSLRMRPEENLRLRLLHHADDSPGNAAAPHSVVIEVDKVLVALTEELVRRDTIARQFTELGLIAAGDVINVRPFKSGSLSASISSDYRAV